MTKKDIFSLARKEILKLIPYKSARDDFSNDQKKMIMMDANENPFENLFRNKILYLFLNLFLLLNQYLKTAP